MARRVFFGELNGRFIARVSVAGWDAATAPWNKLLFCESAAGLRLFTRTTAGGGFVSFGRTFSAPPFAVCGIYEPSENYIFEPGRSSNGAGAPFVVSPSGITGNGRWLGPGQTFEYAIFESP